MILAGLPTSGFPTIFRLSSRFRSASSDVFRDRAPMDPRTMCPEQAE